MRCPSCNCQDTRVLDSRPSADSNSIKRRRECPVCSRRFTTYEVIDTVPITVLKRDGSKEFFDKHKLVLGIGRACQKRPVDPEAIASAVENDLQNSIVNEISSKDIGELVLKKLRDVDIISYIRFASVYREFSDIDSFMTELRRLSRSEKRKSRASSGGGEND